ncbi:site-specific integrase [Halobellus ruber]|uniref:Tyrosine-type recombinase/integrase n=1 Tax=Halobellus ruber TaxID=2761102 RepID=A0A7J9SET6_9EURY|nr:site-specific integrase [Halobellus ruber]MBB6645032.1 tyrosine-type recombinase/integrase [Halobellus ruber]
MTEYVSESIERLRDRLEESDDISDADAEILRRFSDELRILGPSKYGDYAHEKYLMRLVAMAEGVGGLADAIEDEDAARRIVAWINTEKTGSPETNKDYRVALRQLGAVLTDGDDPPVSLAWVPGGYPDNYDPAPDPSDLVGWDEDVVPMIESCHNARDKAVIALAFDLGPRPHELYDLEVGAFADHKYGLQVTVEGKTGQRSPVLVPSVRYVTRWLDEHPGEDDDPFVSRLNRPEAVSNNYIRDIFKDAADRAGVEKPVTPRYFRKASASHLASKGVSQAHIEDHHGWTRGSDIAARYVAVFGDANDREIAAAHGVDVEQDEPTPIAPVPCPRCDADVPRHKDFCPECKQSMDVEATALVEEFSDLLDELLVDADDADERQDLIRARRRFESRPDDFSKDDLHRYLSSLSD